MAQLGATLYCDAASPYHIGRPDPAITKMSASRLARLIEQLEINLRRKLTPEERRLLSLSEIFLDENKAEGEPEQVRVARIHN